MRSLYIVFPNQGDVEVREEAAPSPGPEEVLCQAEKSLISVGTETNCLRGDFDAGTNWETWVQYPFRPGYSMVGRVIAVGKGITSISVGDRVAGSVSHQQIFSLSADRAYIVPEGVSAEEAAWLSLANTAQLGVRRASLALGETVGVIGLGVLGQLTVQFLANMGVRKIIAIDLDQKPLALAKAHGASHTLAMSADRAPREVAALTEGRMLDAVFDVTGNPLVLAAAIQLLRRLGRVILLGDTPNPSQQILGPGVVSNSIAILGIHASMRPARASEFNPWTYREMAALFFEFLTQGRMRVTDLVTRRESPRDAPKVYRDLQRERAKTIGVIFDWNRI